MGKVSTLTHFPLEARCENFLFLLYQAVVHFEHGLNSNLAYSIETPEMDASFDKPVIMAS